MKSSFRSRSTSITRNYDAIIAAMAGFFIIYAFTRHSGIGVSPDSVDYMSAAAHFREHGTLHDFSGSPLVDFPAFYPIFLSTIMLLTGKDCMQFAPLLNGLLFAGLIWLSGWLMERFSFRSRWYKWILLGCIVLSPCLLEVYSMLWSETLFIPEILLFILLARRYFGSHSRGALAGMALITGLACITRYAGITLIGTGGLLVLCDPGLKAGRKLRHGLFFGLLSSLPLVINFYQNKLVTGTLTGYREKGIVSFGQNLHDFGGVFCSWLPYFNTHGGFATVIGLFWILFFAGCFTARLLKREGNREHFFSHENMATAYFLVYAAFILLSATVSRFQKLDSRLLSPLFIPWLWGASCLIPGRVAALAPLPRAVMLTLVLAGATWFLRVQVLVDGETWDGVKDAGIPGYTEDGWVHSETMDYVRRNKDKLRPPGATLYTNASEGIWFLTGVHADMIPHKDFAADIREFLGQDHFYVVWFDDGLNPDLLPIDSISRHKQIAEERSFNDGTVYFFKTDTTAPRRP